MTNLDFYEGGYPQYFLSVPFNYHNQLKNILNKLLVDCFGSKVGNFTIDSNPLIVASDNNFNPVGVLNFYNIDSTRIFIYGVCVDPAHRGKKIGTLLFKHLLSVVPPQYDYFELNVDWDNLPVIKFYTQLIFCDWYLDKNKRLTLYGYRNTPCDTGKEQIIYKELEMALAVLNNIDYTDDFEAVYKLFQKIMSPGVFIKYFIVTEKEVRVAEEIEPTHTDCAISVFQILKEIDSISANLMRRLYCGVGIKDTNIISYFKTQYPQYKWDWIHFNLPAEEKLLQALLYMGLPREGAVFAGASFKKTNMSHAIVFWKDLNNIIYILDPQISPAIHRLEDYNFFGEFPKEIHLLSYYTPPKPDFEVEMKDVDTVAQTLFRKL